MVSTRPPTSKSPSPLSNPLVTIPDTPITIGTIVTFMFHSFFFNSLARSRYLSFFSHSFSFILWSAETAKSTILQILLLLVSIILDCLIFCKLIDFNGMWTDLGLFYTYWLGNCIHSRFTFIFLCCFFRDFFIFIFISFLHTIIRYHVFLSNAQKKSPPVMWI